MAFIPTASLSSLDINKCIVSTLRITTALPFILFATRKVAGILGCAADTLELYDHIPGSGCPFDIWQQTWERHERNEGGSITTVTPTVGKIGQVSSITPEG